MRATSPLILRTRRSSTAWRVERAWQSVVALVVFLKGVNVGGHRRLRPLLLAEQLRHLDAVNVGAAGTLVIRKRVGRARLRAEIARRLPFDAAIAICEGREIVGLLAHASFAGLPRKTGIVRFVSMLSRVPRPSPKLPQKFPSRGKWLLKVLSRDGRFVFGVYRRHMKVIGYLRSLDEVFGVPATTRNWNTIRAVSKVVTAGATQ